VNAKPKPGAPLNHIQGQAIATPQDSPHPPYHKRPFPAFLAPWFFVFCALLFGDKPFTPSRLARNSHFFFLFLLSKTKDLAAHTSETKDLQTHQTVKKRPILGKKQQFIAKTPTFCCKKKTGHFRPDCGRPKT